MANLFCTSIIAAASAATAYFFINPPTPSPNDEDRQDRKGRKDSKGRKNSKSHGDDSCGDESAASSSDSKGRRFRYQLKARLVCFTCFRMFGSRGKSHISAMCLTCDNVTRHKVRQGHVLKCKDCDNFQYFYGVMCSIECARHRNEVAEARELTAAFMTINDRLNLLPVAANAAAPAAAK